MRYLRCKSRDNSRTPMHWDDSPYAGFSTVEPWIMVNPNYKRIHAKEQLAREDSVFHYYQRLIRLRKEHAIIVYGSYQLLLPEDPDLYVYTRELDGERLLVLCNFREQAKECVLPQGWDPDRMERLIGNYQETKLGTAIKLKPYEAIVYGMTEGERAE